MGSGLVALAFALTLPASALARGPAGGPLLEIAAPFSPLLAAPSTDTSVTIGLTVAQTDPVRPTLDLRGRSVDREETGAYEVDTNISRIPCPGEYRFHAATEDSSNGNSSSYSALLQLLSLSTRPGDARCGGTPPPRPGRMTVLLQDSVNRLFVVRGSRSNAGAFEGGLSLSSLPECDRSYVLEAVLDLAGWNRSADFKVQTIKFSSTLQGRPVESRRC